MSMDELLSFYPAVSKICEKLDLKELKNLSVASKSWLEITSEIIVKRTLFHLSLVSADHVMQRNYQFVKLTRETKNFNIPSSAISIVLKVPLYEKHFVQLQVLKKLKHLKIYEVILSYPTAAQLNYGLDSLSIIIWNEKSYSLLKNLLAANKNSLNHLNTQEYGVMEFDYLKDMQFPKLNSLSLSFSHADEIRNTVLEDFLVNHENLETILLKRFYLTDNFFKVLLNSCRNTHNLSLIEGCAKDVHISELSKMTILQTLLIKNLYMNFNEFLCIKMSNLKHLAITFEEIISEELLDLFLKNHPKLNKLVMIFKDNQKVNFAAFGKLIPEITHLHLDSAKLYFEKTCTSMAEFQNLHCFVLSNCRIDDAIFESLYAPKLRIFYFNKSHLNDHGIKILTARCPMIEQLSLESCKELTDFSTKYIVENLHYLKKIDISSCKNISILSLELLLTKSMIVSTICQYSSISPNNSELKKISESNGFKITIDDGWKITNGTRTILL